MNNLTHTVAHKLTINKLLITNCKIQIMNYKLLFQIIGSLAEVIDN